MNILPGYPRKNSSIELKRIIRIRLCFLQNFPRDIFAKILNFLKKNRRNNHQDKHKNVTKRNWKNMPSRQIHIKFDKYLIERDVLIDSSYSKIHTFIDKGTGTFGGQHREQDFYHSEEGIRQYLNGKIGIFGQELTTSWLRAGFGHLCLDKTATRRGGMDQDKELFKSAYQSMVRGGYTKKYFRQRK